MKTKRVANSILFHAFSLLLGFVMIYPLLWLIASSFKNNSEIFVSSFSLIPHSWGIAENYSSGWQGISGQGFGTFMVNSTIVTIAGTAGGVVSSVMAAYALSRVRFKGAGFWFSCVIITQLIPPQVMVVPQYIIFRYLNLTNTLFSLMAPWIFGRAFFIFLMVQFFRGLPKDLDEAAAIDGCGKIQILTKILLPLISPAIVTSCIFSSYWIWEDFFQPLIFINNPVKFTVPLALNLFTDANSYSNYGGMFAMSAVSLLPVITIFVLFQKHLVEGIATTGMKG